MNLEDCIREGHIRRIRPDKNMIDKEIKEAKYDLEKA